MAIYLDEDWIGDDTQEIAYPHLLLCMGVTCLMSDGRLIGAHVSNGTTEMDLLREVKRRIDAYPGERPFALYVTGNLAEHNRHRGQMPADKARTLGYRGRVYVYDTVRLQPTDGSFVRIVSNGAIQLCTVHAMLDQAARPYQVVHTPGGHPGRVLTRGVDGTFRAPTIYKVGTQAPSPAPLTPKDFMEIRVN